MMYDAVMPFLYTKEPNSAHSVASCVHLCCGTTHDSHVLELAYCPSAHKWIEKMWSIHTKRYKSTLRNKACVSFSGRLSSQ